MTLINRLIKEAREGATRLTIRDKDVSSVAEHCRMLAINPVHKETVEAGIRRGDLRLHGVPVEVEHDQ